MSHPFEEKIITHVTENARAKLFYGVGSVAYGVKDNAFLVYLLFYYTLIHQLPATLVSLALLIAVAIDAVSDPIIGQLSDNLRTRLGRRHPMMIAAAIPSAVFFYFLWLPPEGLTDTEMFWYLLGVASLTRLSITFYEIPAAAMLPELTQNYDQRVQFASVRYFFGWIGGAGISMAALAFIFNDSAAFPNGLANPAAYQTYALVGAAIMAATTLMSASGTMRYIPHLITDDSERIDGIGAIFRNLWSVLTDKVFAPVFGTAILAALAFGISLSLSLFFNTYFWGFSTAQMAILGLSALIGAGLAPIIAPLATRGKLGKRRAAILLGMLAAILIPMPALLRLLGVLPDNGSPLILPIIFVQQTTVIAIGVATDIIIHTMVADVVEDNERRTGRRSAGVFFAARTFAQKSTNGLGVMAGGIIVGIAGLEKGMSREAATADMVATLGEIYVPVIMTIYIAAITILRFYPITRQRHAENLSALGRTKE